MLKWQQMGGAAVVGALSSAGDYYKPEGFNVGGNAIRTGGAVEIGAVVAGMALQQFSPYSYPEVVEGMIDGAIALVTRRASAYALNKTRPAGYAGPYPQLGAGMVNGWNYGSGMALSAPQAAPMARPLVSPVAGNIRGKLS